MHLRPPWPGHDGTIRDGRGSRRHSRHHAKRARRLDTRAGVSRRWGDPGRHDVPGQLWKSDLVHAGAGRLRPMRGEPGTILEPD